MKQFFRVEFPDKNTKTNLDAFFDTWERGEEFSRWLIEDKETTNVFLSWWVFDNKRGWYKLKYKKEIK